MSIKFMVSWWCSYLCTNQLTHLQPFWELLPVGRKLPRLLSYLLPAGSWPHPWANFFPRVTKFTTYRSKFKSWVLSFAASIWSHFGTWKNNSAHIHYTCSEWVNITKNIISSFVVFKEACLLISSGGMYSWLYNFYVYSCLAVAAVNIGHDISWFVSYLSDCDNILVCRKLWTKLLPCDFEFMYFKFLSLSLNYKLQQMWSVLFLCLCWHPSMYTYTHTHILQ